eukprot:GEMP01013192.1.p1 GENE.GEMP01013192.1~~GEMP01013192.1.p1  ORF type:complete len:587 (+),score=157.43 GEMP01013192.1:122-1882(+)
MATSCVASPDDEVELPYIQELIDTATRDADKASKKLRAVLQSHQTWIDQLKRNITQADDEMRSFLEFYESAQLPSTDLEAAETALAEAEDKFTNINLAVQRVEPMFEAQRQLEALDDIDDMQKAVAKLRELRQTLERLSPPAGQPAPRLLLTLRQHYARVRRKWRLMVEDRFAKLFDAFSSNNYTECQHDNEAWSAAESLDIASQIVDALATHVVHTLSGQHKDFPDTPMTPKIQATFDTARAFVPAEHFSPLVRKLWPAIARLAKLSDLEELLTWEEELVTSYVLEDFDPGLARRVEDMRRTQSAALRLEVLARARKSLIADVTPLNVASGAGDRATRWISSGCEAVVTQIRIVEREGDAQGVILHDILSAFTILRPEKGSVRRNAMEACLFFNDCQYMVRHCAGAAAPKMPALRRLGEKHFLTFLTNCVNEYRNVLRVNLFSNVDRQYTVTEAACAQVLQSLSTTCDAMRKWLDGTQAQIVTQWLLNQLCDIIWEHLGAQQVRPRPSLQETEALQLLLTPLANQVEKYGGPRHVGTLCSMMTVEWETIRRARWSNWSRDRIRILLFLNPKVLRPHSAISDLQID